MLVKSLLRDVPPSLRVQQFIRSRIVWRSAQGLTVPLTAVVRISGQYFCFVAEKGAQGGLVAKQKPIEVGELIGNDYVVRSGLKAGETLIVSGIQKIGDGAPRARRVANRQSAMFVDTFIRRPILASVCSLVLILAGAVAIPTMPVAQYPSLARRRSTSRRSTPAPTRRKSRRRSRHRSSRRSTASRACST